MQPIALLILGLGNMLCEDDGAGVAAVARICRDYTLPEGARVLDGGTLGLSLLPYLQDAERLILVDAILGNKPGDLVRLDGSDVAHAAAHRMSVHQIGVSDLLHGVHLTGRAPSVMVLHGVVPASMELSVELTPAVEAALPKLIDNILNEAASLGFPFERRVEAA